MGGNGGDIGYGGIQPSLGIEFDTYQDQDSGDPDGNHVGIDLNGSVVSVATQYVTERMNDGNDWYAWVDYDGASQLLQVRLAQTATRPDTALLSYSINLPQLLGTPDAYVGFTAGTGAGNEDQDILSWQFDNTYAPIGSAAAEQLTVTGVSATTTTLTCLANPSVYGESVTFTATVSVVSAGSGTATASVVSAGSDTPTGTVTFSDGTVVLGTSPLSGTDVATFTPTSLAVGTHTITASYGGDTNFPGSDPICCRRSTRRARRRW